MATTLQKGMILFAGMAVIGGSLAGAGLARFAQNGAFEFYKQTPPPVQHDLAAAPMPAGGYAAASPPPAWPENPYPPRPLTIARPAESADYQRAAHIDPDPPVVEEQAALPEPLPGPVIVPQRGSWSAPAKDTQPTEPEAPAEDPVS